MRKIILLLSLVLFFLTACVDDPAPTELPTLDEAILFETAISQSTADYEATQRHLPTQTLTPTNTVTPIPTIDRTRPPLQSPTAEALCDKAAAGQPFDITIPDGTVMTPGERFSKTWRLINAGSCTWTRLYTVTFFSGNRLNAFHTKYLPQPVEPGDVIDVTIEMEAPHKVGVYQSNWMLSNADGELFGIGPYGDAPFWTLIEVIQSVTETPQPTSTMTKTPVVYVTGAVALSDSDQFDLDSAIHNPTDLMKSDLVYQYGGNPTHILISMNSTQWMAYGEEKPSLNDCNNAEMTGNDIGFEDVPKERYYCYRTSQGLPGWLLVEGFEAGQLSIRFLTWSVP